MSTTKTASRFFTDRETYLRYRADWKRDYAKLSEDIRKLKRHIAQSFKDGGSPGYEQNNLRTNQQIAFDMLEELKEAKVEAQRQYVAERAAMISA